MKKEHADLLMNSGELRINNLKYYKTIENKALQDNTEGFVFNSITKDPTKGKLLKKTPDGDWIDVTDSPNELISTVTSEMFQQREVGDALIICTSFSSEPELFEGYDACIEILDTEFFTLIGKDLLKRRLIEFFIIDDKQYIAMKDPVKYIDSKWTKKIPDTQIYFVKEKVPFERDQEYRVVFKPVLRYFKDDAEPAEVRIPELSKYCRRVR